MRHDDADEETTKDSVDADDLSDKGGSESEEDDEDHDALRRTLLEAAGSVKEANEERSNDEDENEDPADSAEDNVEDRDARSGVGEGDGESEKAPADDIVAYACRQRRHADVIAQEAELGEDARQYREGGDGHGDADEEEKVTKIGVCRVDESIVDADCDGCAQGEGQDHADDGDGEGCPEVLAEDCASF